jgi:hypothetical protein
MTTPLDDLQHAFAEALRDPQRMADGRFAIYGRTAHAHWLAALANAYPVLKALTGDVYFSHLTRAYAEAHPSRSGDLNQFGEHLDAFIGSWESDPRYWYFSDIARLEWAIHLAWYAADPHSLSIGQWQQLDSTALLSNAFRTHPAAHAISSRHPIADIWRAHQPGGSAFPGHIDQPTWALVVRPEWRPFVIDQSEAGHRAFIALQNGSTLNDAIDTALRIDPAFDIALQLQTWIGVNAITGPAT